MTSYDVKCSGAAATQAFGERLGKQLKGSEVIELAGDLGAGKTTLVRGLAQGIGSSDHVSSPTFVIGKVYQGRLDLHHYDLYRLGEPGLAARQLAEILAQDENAVIVVEWADSVSSVLSTERIVIQFETIADEQRLLHITVPEKMGYLKC